MNFHKITCHELSPYIGRESKVKTSVRGVKTRKEDEKNKTKT